MEAEDRVEQVIYLDDDDDLGSIRERLTWAEARRVLLVLPKRFHILANRVNLKLLQRYAEDLAVEVALVTRMSRIQVLAREVDLPVFSSVEQGQRKKEWRRVEAKAVPAPDRPAVTLPTIRLRPLRGEEILGVAIFGGLLILLAAGVLLVVPSASVTLVPLSEEVSASLEIQADPQLDGIDYQAGRIPARIVEAPIDGTAQTATTAQQDVPDARATGTVVLVNKRDETTVVPQGTVLSTSGGQSIKFQTISEATLAAEGRAEVGIVAVDPGPMGNVPAFSINVVEGSLALAVNVVNVNPTEGGSVKRVAVVTAEDKRRLRDTLVQRLRQESLALLKDQLEEQEFVPPESVTVEVLNETYDKFVDESADLLTLTLHGQAKGTAVDGYKANALALRHLEGEIKEGYQLIPEELTFTPGAVTGVENGVVSFMMEISGRAVTAISPGEVKGIVRGKPIDLAVEHLRQELPLAEEPTVEVSPNWFGRLPLFPFRIYVTVKSD